MSTKEIWLNNSKWTLTESEARKLRLLILAGTFLVQRGKAIGSIFEVQHPVEIQSKEFGIPVKYDRIPICFTKQDERVCVKITLPPSTVSLSGTVGAVIICNKLAELFGGTAAVNISVTPYYKNKTADWVDVRHGGDLLEELWLDMDTILVRYENFIYDSDIPDEKLKLNEKVSEPYPAWVKETLTFITC